MLCNRSDGQGSVGSVTKMNSPAKLEYVKAEPISLKSHPDFTEAWLHDRIL